MAKAAKKAVCVDLDGTLASYDGWKGPEHIGTPLTGAREFMTTLQQTCRVIVFTTRSSGADAEIGLKAVEAWLAEHQIPYDEIWRGSGKSLASAYVDDRAVPCCPQRDGFAAYQQAYETVKRLCVG